MRTKAGVTIRIRTDPNTFKDARARNLSKKWFFADGSGNETEFAMSDMSQMDHALGLIKQLYQATNL